MSNTQTVPRLSREEYEQKKAERANKRKAIAEELMKQSLPAVFTTERFCSTLLDSEVNQVRGFMRGLYPTQYKSGKLGYMGVGKVAIGDHVGQVSIIVTLLDDTTPSITRDEIAELEAMEKNQMEASEHT